jgi:hypothetical protein
MYRHERSRCYSGNGHASAILRCRSSTTEQLDDPECHATIHRRDVDLEEQGKEIRENKVRRGDVIIRTAVASVKLLVVSFCSRSTHRSLGSVSTNSQPLREILRAKELVVCSFVDRELAHGRQQNEKKIAHGNKTRH